MYLPLERLDVEEPQRSRSLRHRFRRQLPFPQQVELILTDVLGAKLVGSTMKVFSELLNRMQVAPCVCQASSCDARVLRASGLRVESQ